MRRPRSPKSLGRVQRGLRGTGLSAEQQLFQRQRTVGGVAVGEQSRLVVAACDQTPWGRGDRRNDDSTMFMWDRQGCHRRRHQWRQFRPPLVLERVHEVVRGRRQHIREARRQQRRGPVPAPAALQIARASGAARKMAPLTARPRRHLESGTASGTHERRLRTPWHPEPTGDAAGRQQQVAQVGGPRCHAHSGWLPFIAARITSTGAGSLHQRSNEAAACCTSISAPSVARMPKASAARTNGVGFLPYTRSIATPTR